MNSPWKIPLAIIFGGVIIALAVYFSIAKSPATSSRTGNPSLVRAVDSSDHILGSPTAPIKIIEYSDFDCDYCKNFHEIMHEVVANEGAGGKVAWIYRQFPLTELEGHENSLKHARAAECVAKVAGNDGFWKFADALFATKQPNQPIDPSKYGALAASAGASGADFSACYTDAEALIDARIKADRQNALDTGGTGTPHSILVVEGKPPFMMTGAWSYDAIKLLLDQALAN